MAGCGDCWDAGAAAADGVRLRCRLIDVRLRRRSAGEPRRVGLRHALELLRQPIEAGVDFAEFFAGQRGFALDLGFAFALAAARRRFVMVTVVSMACSAARRLILFGRPRRRRAARSA